MKPGQKYWEEIPKTGLPATPLSKVAAINGNGAYVLTGNPNSPGYVYRYSGTSWTKVPGAALDIALDMVGNLYAIGTGDILWKLPGGQGVWTALPSLPAGAGKPLRIGAGGAEQVWVVTNANEDFKWAGPNPAQPSQPVWVRGNTNTTITDVAVARDGSAWFASGNGNVVVNRGGTITQLPTVLAGAAPQNVAVGGNNKVFALATMQVFKYSGYK